MNQSARGIASRDAVNLLRILEREDLTFVLVGFSVALGTYLPDQLFAEGGFAAVERTAAAELLQRLRTVKLNGLALTPWQSACILAVEELLGLVERNRPVAPI